MSQLNEDGSVEDFETHPEEFGLPEHSFEEILGGTPLKLLLTALFSGEKSLTAMQLF